MFGSGFALAYGFDVSGLSDWLAQCLTALKGVHIIFIILGICVIVTIISEFASNIASIQLAIPVMIALQKDLDSGGYIPLWTIKTITWVDEDDYIVMQADTYISISQDPYVKFKYNGNVRVIAEDTKGNIFKK